MSKLYYIATYTDDIYEVYCTSLKQARFQAKSSALSNPGYEADIYRYEFDFSFVAFVNALNSVGWAKKYIKIESWSSDDGINVRCIPVKEESL